MAQQTPSQREQVRALQPQAVASWWSNGHPGWAIHPLDSEQFLATGGAEPMPAPPPVMHGTPPPQQPMGLPAELLAGGMFGGMLAQQQQQQQQMPAWAANPQLLQQLAAAGAATVPQQSPQPPPVPQAAANGGFDFGAGNLSVFQSLLPAGATGMSFPATMPSADLEGMLTPGASILGLGYNPRLPSLGKLESIELHQDGNVDAVAMLHDLTANARGLQTPRMSALESMQSIEQSLEQG